MVMRKLLPVFIILCLAFVSPKISSAVEKVGSGFLGGESIHRLSLTDPLGASGFIFDAKSEFQRLVVDTSSYDLHFSLAYGIMPGLDFSFYIPYMRLTQGPYNKYGSGDALFSLKYVRTKPAANPYSWGIQGYMLIPSGLRKEVYGFPEFTRDQNGYGTRLLFQLDSRKVTLVTNLGAFYPEKGPSLEIFYGGGVRINVLGKMLQVAGEFTTNRINAEKRSETFAFGGARLNLPYLGLGAKLGVESELQTENPPRLVAGLTFTFKKTLPGVSKGILETKGYYKNIIVFDFVDKEENFTGEDMQDKIIRKLGSLNDVTIVEPSDKISWEKAVKNRTEALKQSEDSGADLLVFGHIQKFGYKRSSGLGLPYLFGFPRTTAYLTADIWVVDTKSEEQIFSERITGRASQSRGVALFPPPGDSLNDFLTVDQKETLREKAVDDFIRKLSARFSYQLQ